MDEKIEAGHWGPGQFPSARAIQELLQGMETDEEVESDF
jgi:hypothetical protein